MAKPSSIISAALPLLNWLKTQNSPAYEGLNVIVQAIDDLNQKFYTDKNSGTVGINNTNTLNHAALDIGGHINASPVSAGYTVTSSTVGTGEYIWDTELFTTSNNYFGRETGNQEIICRVPGYYQINVNVVVDNSVLTPIVQLQKNGASVQSATGIGSGTNGVSITAIVYLEYNDRITVVTFDGDRYGDSSNLSTLFITRLN